jgi:hypothetical protein
MRLCGDGMHLETPVARSEMKGRVMPSGEYLKYKGKRAGFRLKGSLPAGQEQNSIKAGPKQPTRGCFGQVFD